MKKELLTGLSGVVGIIGGAVAMGVLNGKRVEEKTGKIDKFRGYYDMLNQWLILKQEGHSLIQYFLDNGYKTVAIYGMGEMGSRLYDELKESSIEIKYAIDKNVGGVYSEVEVIDVGDKYEDVDVIVVTATFAFDEVRNMLEKKVTCPIVSLEDVVYES